MTLDEQLENYRITHEVAADGRELLREARDLEKGLDAAMRWINDRMFLDHIKPERIDVAQLHADRFSPAYIEDVLAIRKALRKA